MKDKPTARRPPAGLGIDVPTPRAERASEPRPDGSAGSTYGPIQDDSRSLVSEATAFRHAKLTLASAAMHLQPAPWAWVWHERRSASEHQEVPCGWSRQISATLSLVSGFPKSAPATCATHQAVLSADGADLQQVQRRSSRRQAAAYQYLPYVRDHSRRLERPTVHQPSQQRLLALKNDRCRSLTCSDEMQWMISSGAPLAEKCARCGKGCKHTITAAWMTQAGVWGRSSASLCVLSWQEPLEARWLHVC